MKELDNLFINQAHDFWSDFFTFESRRAELSNPGKKCLLGQDRARDIVVNVLLPAIAAYAAESADFRLKNTVSQLYELYPIAFQFQYLWNNMPKHLLGLRVGPVHGHRKRLKG